jgi:lysozyme
LMYDIRKFERAVDRLIKVPLTQGQYDSLVSFSFNLGSGALQSSTLRRKLNRSEYESAADEFPKWVFAGGRKLKGLIRRRYAERELYLSEM